MEEIYNSLRVSLKYAKDKKLIELAWKKKAESDEFREMFSNLVEFATRNKVKYFVSDLREEGHVPVEDLRWLDNFVLTKATEVGIERIALVTTDETFNTIYAETIKRKLSNTVIQVQIFADMASAYAWITLEE